MPINICTDAVFYLFSCVSAIDYVFVGQIAKEYLSTPNNSLFYGRYKHEESYMPSVPGNRICSDTVTISKIFTKLSYSFVIL